MGKKSSKKIGMKMTEVEANVEEKSENERENNTQYHSIVLLAMEMALCKSQTTEWVLNILSQMCFMSFTYSESIRRKERDKASRRKKWLRMESSFSVCVLVLELAFWLPQYRPLEPSVAAHASLHYIFCIFSFTDLITFPTKCIDSQRCEQKKRFSNQENSISFSPKKGNRHPTLKVKKRNSWQTKKKKKIRWRWWTLAIEN